MDLNKKQVEFIDLAISGKNIFLTGAAGTGKSAALKRAISILKESEKKVIAVAPTGIAANHIGGQTIHSVFSLNPSGILTFRECNFLKQEKRRLLEAIDTIVIDEASMVRPDILDAINWTFMKNGLDGLRERQVIFVGDFRQLKPVINDNTRSVMMRTYDGDTMFHAKVYPSLSVVDIELDEVVRQSDIEFIDALNIVRNGGKSDYFRRFVHTEQNNGIVLAPYNTTVAEYNKKGLESLKTEAFVFDAVVTGNARADEFNLDSKVVVKQGAKVMYLINSKDAPLFNGTMGVFASHEGNHYIQVNGIDYPLQTIEFEKKEYVLNEKENDLELRVVGSIKQVPIRLAYALSVHKAQGLSLPQVTLDLSRPCFSEGMLYVALSRVTTPSGLRILTGGRDK